MKKTSAESDYFLKFYLDSDPFPPGSRDTVLFLPQVLERRLGKIISLVDSTESFVIVTAPEGGGKTSLFRHLPTLRKDDWVVGSIRADGTLLPERFAEALLQGVAPPEGEQTGRSITRLHKFLEQCDQHKLKPVFLVDDAHRLPSGTLDLLMDLSGLRYNRSLFHFVLFAEDTLLDQIEDIGITGDSAANLRTVPLPGFPGELASDYILHRLSACGLKGASPLNEDQLGYIRRVSGGLPGGINVLAREQLLALSGDTGAGKGSGTIVALVAVLGLLGAGGWYFFNQRPSPPPPPVAAAAPAPVAVPSAADEVEADTPVDEIDAAIAAIPEPAPPAEPVAGEPVPVEDEDEETLHTVGMVAVAPPVAADEVEPAPASDAPAVTPVAEPALSPARDDTKVATVADESTAGVPVTETAATTEAPAETNVWSYATPGTTDTGHGNGVTAWRNGVRGPDWIRAQPEGTWFLQLVNASQLDNAEKLLRDLSHVSGDLSAYTNYTPSGKLRYLVLYGSYADREAADLAIDALDPAVRSIPPWPRSRSSILKDIDDALSRGLAP